MGPKAGTDVSENSKVGCPCRHSNTIRFSKAEWSTQPAVQWVPGALPESTANECELVHSYPFDAAVRNGGSYTHTSLVCLPL